MRMSRIVDGGARRLVAARDQGGTPFEPAALLRVVTGSNAELFDLLKQRLYSDPLVVIVRAGHPILEHAAVSFAQLIAYPPADCIETLSISFARNLVLRSDAV